MPKCVPCLGSEVKAAITAHLQDAALDALLKRIPDCQEPAGLEVCGKKPRARSKYQEFVTACMKGKGLKGKGFGAAAPALKECASEWRKARSHGLAIP